MSASHTASDDGYDWHLSDKQHRMISDKIRHLSKKEASLVIRFLEHCIFGNRASEKPEQIETKQDVFSQ